MVYCPTTKDFIKGKPMQPNIYTVSGLKTILGEENASPLKALGQNFLINERVVERMVEESGLTDCDGALEIGPGVGALTQKLCETAKKVVAVELDKKMVEILKTTAPKAEVIQGDAMKADLKDIIEKSFSDCRRVLVFGNLPYYITTPILMRFIEEDLPIHSVTAMVQKEAGQRLCAIEGSRDSGAVTLAVRYRCIPSILFGVSSGNFFPAPRVDSCVINLVMLERKGKPLSEVNMFRVIRVAFSARRKTLLNSLSAGLSVDKSAMAEALDKCEVNPAARAEKLSVADYILISDYLTRCGLL